MNSYKPVARDLPCDIHLINLRTMVAPPKSSSGNGANPSDKVALVLHRQGFTSCFRPLGMTCSTNGGKISVDELFPELFSTDLKQMSLSLMYDGTKMEKSFTVSIQPMEMYSFLLARWSKLEVLKRWDYCSKPVLKLWNVLSISNVWIRFIFLFHDYCKHNIVLESLLRLSQLQSRRRG